MPAERVVSVMVTSVIECRACGDSKPVPLPCSMERILETFTQFKQDHALCATAEGADAASLGARLRAARVAKRLTQEQVAAALGTATTALSHWETGRREPSLTNLRKLARAVGVTVAQLLGEEAARG